MNRRRFLRAAGTSGLALATLPAVVDSFTVRALAAGDGGLDRLLAGSDRILILIQLQGGNDGLNTAVPYADPLYYKRRPNIAIPAHQALRIDDTLGWHPSLSGFDDLYKDGKLALVQGVTYPNPDRSHFRGTDIWLTATDADVFGSTGWVGRYLQTLAPGYPQELPPHPLAVQIGTSLSLGLLGGNGPMGISFRDPDEFYRLVNTGATDEVPAAPSSDTPAGREVSFMRSIARSADVYARVVKDTADRGTIGTTFPTTDIGAKLRVVSQLIAGGLQSRVYLVSWANNNFDTHADQGGVTGNHARLLRELGDAVGALMAEMKRQGLQEKVAGMTFSEFGRRVAENGSQGTDHGTAAPLFVFGQHVDGGKVFGRNPDLQNLDERGDLLMQYDYRHVYASVLLQYFGESQTTAQNVLLRDFSQQALPLFHVPVSVQDDGQGMRCGFRSVSPNPASTTVQVRVDCEPFADAGLRVSDMQGRFVRAVPVDAWSGIATFDVQGMSPGTYLLTLHADRATMHTFLTVSR